MAPPTHCQLSAGNSVFLSQFWIWELKGRGRFYFCILDWRRRIFSVFGEMKMVFWGVVIGLPLFFAMLGISSSSLPRNILKCMKVFSWTSYEFYRFLTGFFTRSEGTRRDACSEATPLGDMRARNFHFIIWVSKWWKPREAGFLACGFRV